MGKKQRSEAQMEASRGARARRHEKHDMEPQLASPEREAKNQSAESVGHDGDCFACPSTQAEARELAR